MRRRIPIVPIALALLVAALVVPAAAVSRGSASALPSAVGPGEGELKMVAWAGYLEKSWVKPFEQQTGCKIKAEVRRHVRRDGDAHALGRWRAVRHGVRLR